VGTSFTGSPASQAAMRTTLTGPPASEAAVGTTLTGSPTTEAAVGTTLTGGPTTEALEPTATTSSSAALAPATAPSPGVSVRPCSTASRADESMAAAAAELIAKGKARDMKRARRVKAQCGEARWRAVCKVDHDGKAPKAGLKPAACKDVAAKGVTCDAAATKGATCEEAALQHAAPKGAGQEAAENGAAPKQQVTHT
jgi:hypothetical protein